MQETQVGEKRGLKARIIAGSVVLLSGSTLSVATNLAYNVAVAHFLGPKGFGNANALYTLLTLMSAITLSFQIITSKFVAQRSDAPSRDAAYRSMHKAAWMSGLLVAALLFLFKQQITTFLDLPDSNLVAILSIGAAYYVPLGCRRGYVQGAFGFRKLATNLVFEGLARLFGSLLMIAFGAGVTGVILANSVAMAVAYYAISPKLDRSGSDPIPFGNALRETSHAVIFFAGQVLINNCDIVLVKHFFSPADAGLYAAIAMVGRVIFACSSAIVNGMFPVIAGSKREERNLSVIGTALLLVLVVGATLALGLRLAPSWIWTSLFGASFQIAGPHGFPYLLSLYGITTTVYCLSVVIMTYEMSYKIANTNWLQLLYSGVLIASIYRYHESLRQVIMVQLAILITLLFAITIPFVVDFLRNGGADKSTRKLRILRTLTEDEVISGFLQSEFRDPIYAEYQESMRRVVFAPNHDDPAEREIRRFLLELRHRALWRELPSDTQWFQVAVGPSDLAQIRVFPRAQWARLALGNFSVEKAIERIKQHGGKTEDAFLRKIGDIRKSLSTDTLDTGPVLLIGSSDHEPFTILDGNHRFVAGAMEGTLDRLTFVCGISSNMKHCCWYKTSASSLARYGRNLVKASMEKPKDHVIKAYECAMTKSNDSSYSEATFETLTNITTHETY